MPRAYVNSLLGPAPVAHLAATLASIATLFRSVMHNTHILLHTAVCALHKVCPLLSVRALRLRISQLELRNCTMGFRPVVYPLNINNCSVSQFLYPTRLYKICFRFKLIQIFNPPAEMLTAER